VGVIARTQYGAITRPSPRRRVQFASFRIRFRQVFGLAGDLLAPASRAEAGPVLISELSFLLTAAGQFRIYTGFPFKARPVKARHHKVA
jgi:hypothetical protein